MSSIDKILKAKSKEEIDDLEKRGFKKDSGKWRFVIDIKPLIDKYDDNENIEDFKVSLIEVLQSKKNDLGIFCDDRDMTQYNEIVEDFIKLESSPSADKLDDVLNVLYDWADNNNVWINSF